MSDNVQSMFYNKEIPWHKKGVRLEGLANSEQAIIAASLDWEVVKMPVFYNSPDNKTTGIIFNDKYVVVRKDNNRALGIVGAVYKPLQNKHAFKFFDDVIGSAGAHYETAGALGEGERIWLLAKLPGYIRVKSNDLSEKYLLLTNTHNGSSSIDIMLTPVRVVCQNTLNFALAGASDIAHIRHCAQSDNRIDYVRKTIGIINERFNCFEKLAGELAMISLTKETLDKFVKHAVYGRQPKPEEIKMRGQNIMDEISNIFEHGRGNDEKEIRHTAWAAVNAVAEFVDYKRSSKSGKQTESLLFGSGAAMKQRAWDYALTMK